MQSNGKSIGELWARSVNEKTQPKQQMQNNSLPVKPVKDTETENRKAQFRQSILNANNKQKEQPVNG